MALPTGFDGSRGKGPNVLRVGPNIPEGHSELRRNLEATLASACRVPPELLSEPATGVSRREATRSFIATVRPVANMVASELSRLGVAITLVLPVDADLAGRSRAVVQLVAAGVQLADALEVVGIDVPASQDPVGIDAAMNQAQAFLGSE